MSNPEIPRPNATVHEYGFTEHVHGPDFLPNNANLMPAFHDKITAPLQTELLTSDLGNKVMLTSLIGSHKGLSEVAGAIEEKGRSQYSDQIQGYVLAMLKGIADDNGRGIKTISGPKETIYYAGNTGVPNGRLLRVYLTKVGEGEQGIPIYAKIAACRTKNQENRVYTLLGIAGKVKV